MLFRNPEEEISQIESEVVWLQAIAHTCEAEHGVKLNEIEYGPGLSVDYFVQTNVMQ